MNQDDIIKRIEELKKEKNALILAHYYTSPEIQAIADHLGDSLGLARLASENDAESIILCGVHFMGETAAIVAPNKKVYSPAPDAGCSLADSIIPANLKKWKAENPDGIVISYVNTTAAVKACTDICCTSANALAVVESFDRDQKILFGPDRHLGGFINAVTGRNMELWSGCCKVHDVISSDMIKAALKQYPEAYILIHPEAACSSDLELIEHDRVFFASTAGMLRHAKQADAKEFIIATEKGTICQLQKENPDKTFRLLSEDLICNDMKKITLEKVLDCLENESGRVIIEDDILKRAMDPINRMMEI